MIFPDTPLTIYGTVQDVATKLIDYTDKIQYLYPGKGNPLHVNRNGDFPAKSPDTGRPIPRPDQQKVTLVIVPDKTQPTHGAQITLIQLNDPPRQRVIIRTTKVNPDWLVVASLWAECEQVLLSLNKPPKIKTGVHIPEKAIKILDFYFVDGLTHKEIADKVGRAQQTVSNTITKYRKAYLEEKFGNFR